MAKERGLYLRATTYWMQIGDHRESCKTSNIKDARIYRSARCKEIAEGTFLNIRKEEKIVFKEFASLYLETHSKVNNKGWKNSDWVALNPKNKTGLLAYFGDKLLYEIKPLHIEEYKRERLKASIKPASINRNLSILSSMFNKAISWEKSSTNPMKEVDYLPVKNERLRYFELAEVKNLLDNSINEMKPVIVIAVNMGMRKGEILNLKWVDCDFVKRLICILEQKNGDKSYIPMNEIVYQTLMRVKRQPESAYVFKHIVNFRKNFEKSLTDAKIKDATFHTLRHTFASHLVMSGVNIHTVMTLMRHKSLKMTQRYAHLSKDYKTEAMEVIGAKMDFMSVNSTKISQSEKSTDKQEFENLVSGIELKV